MLIQSLKREIKDKQDLIEKTQNHVSSLQE